MELGRKYPSRVCWDTDHKHLLRFVIYQGSMSRSSRIFSPSTRRSSSLTRRLSTSRSMRGRLRTRSRKSKKFGSILWSQINSFSFSARKSIPPENWTLTNCSILRSDNSARKLVETCSRLDRIFQPFSGYTPTFSMFRTILLLWFHRKHFLYLIQTRNGDFSK